MMKKYLATAIVMIMMAASSFSFLAGGAEIDFITPQAGETLSSKIVMVSGNATPSLDQWLQDTPDKLNEGSLDNLTLNDNGELEVSPYIESFKKDVNNPLIDLGGNYTYNEYGTVLGSLIKDGNTYKLWTMGKNRTGAYNLGYGTSNNGTAFGTFQNGTLALGGPGAFDNVSIMPGTVIKDGATYKMWYTGMDDGGIYRIGYATSTDGITWVKGANGNTVLDLGPVNKFDGGGTGFPAVIKDGNTFKMWYSGLIAYSGNLWQIGYATSNNGMNWTKQNNNDPVLSFGKPTSFDKDGVMGATVIKDGAMYRMWYIGIPKEVVGYATSTDGIVWTREFSGAPVLALGGGGSFDSNAITGITVLREGNKYQMYYSGREGSGDQRIGKATANIEGLTGIFVSNFYDAALVVDWGAIELVTNEPIGTTINVTTRASDDRVDWTTWQDLVDGNSAQQSARYFQFKVIMTTPDGIAIPTLSSLKAFYKAIEKVEISTDNSTWFLATGTNNWNATILLEEGSNTIFVRIFDTTGVPTYATMDLEVDTIRPTGNLQINNNDQYTTNTSVDLLLAAVDASGVTKMRFGPTDNLTGVEWMDFATTATYELPDRDGTLSVFCELMDGTGLISKVFADSVILDTTPPNGSVTINNGAPMSTFLDVVLNLRATDANGVDEMRIGNDDNFTGSEWKNYAAAADWTLTQGDGEKKIFVEYRDKAGMSTVVEDTIILDTIAPTGSVLANGGDDIATSRYIDLSLDAQDANGVSHVMISNEPDFLDSFWVTFNETMEWTLKERIGPQTVYVKFKDTSGLVSNVVSDDIVLDIHEEGFEGSVVINNDDDYTNDLTFDLTLGLIGDDGSSLVMLSDNDTFTGESWIAYNETVTYTTLTTDGKVTIYARFKDSYGIISDTVSDSIIVDTSAPSITIDEPTDGKKVHKPLLTVSGVASDNIELLTVEVQLPNGQWIPVDNPANFTTAINMVDKGERVITVRATDAAGNVNTGNVTIKYTEKATDDNVPGFEATALVLGTFLAVLLISRRKIAKV